MLSQWCVKFNRDHPIQLGGDGHVVEAGASLFRHKQKYHRRRQPARELWVFRLADIGFNPSRVALFLVPNRTSNTLLPLIESTRKDGTIVHTDKWKGYKKVNSSMRFIHRR